MTGTSPATAALARQQEAPLPHARPIDHDRAAQAVEELLDVGVVLEAEHLCMSIRGVRADGSRTVTSTLYGMLRDRPAARQEFLQLVRPSSVPAR